MAETKRIQRKLTISHSPHIHSLNRTPRVMRDVLIALSPAAIMSVYYFGYRAALIIAVCVTISIVTEFFTRKVLRRSSTISDLSAAVTGLLLALTLPVTIPLWMAALGSAAAIIVVKELFGGLGQNFANPAITARIILTVSFSSHMTNWTEPVRNVLSAPAQAADAVATATPLVSGNARLLDLFLGNTAGCLGETCAAALIAGGIYLVIRRVIKPIIPLTYIGVVGILYLLSGQWSGYDVPFYYVPVYQILAGGLMIGAIFMATDYSTSPLTRTGKFIFALGCGILTFLIRMFANYPDGVSFSILIMNILTPSIDRLTAHKAFAGIYNKKERALK
ncbi:MAG: RnfABCDGE type electron transport complex subunit D [Oscillospiraceae bacterium]|nr:RnfABCDGE type electron transport complex subunit D [Oscillospiraceae bacterium]